MLEEMYLKRRERDQESLEILGHHRFEPQPEKVLRPSVGMPSRQFKLDDSVRRLGTSESDSSRNYQFTQDQHQKLINQQKQSFTQDQRFDNSSSYGSESIQFPDVSRNILPHNINSGFPVIPEEKGESTFRVDDSMDENQEMQDDFDHFNWDPYIEQQILKIMGHQSKQSITLLSLLQQIRSPSQSKY